MSTVDVQTSTWTLVDVRESTLLIRKVDAPMSTSVASVQSEVDTQVTTSTRRRQPKLYKSVCVCVYIYTHTHTNTHLHTHPYKALTVDIGVSTVDQWYQALYHCYMEDSI